MTGTLPYTWVGIVGGILGIAGMFGGVFAVLKSSVTTNTIKVLRDENDILTKQNARQARDMEIQAATMKTMQARLDKQEEQMQYLKDLVSGTKIMEEVNEKVDRILVALGEGKAA